MWTMLWPILLVVGANTVYNLCAKAVPSGASPFAALSITYLVGAACSLAMFFITSKEKNLFTAFSQCNWASYLLGAASVALELGYIYIYRAGWKTGVGSLVANVTVACILMFIGFLFFKEGISFKQIAGVAVCGLGLFLLIK